MDSWNELGNPRDLSTVFDTPDYAGWNSLRDSENSRYLAITLPRVLSRSPYGQNGEPVDEFNFEEATDGHEGKNYAWMNAAHAMAVNINRAHKEYGWTVQIRGVQSGGEVANLPVHNFDTGDGSTDMKCPTEYAISDRREGELSKSGLISLVHRKNTDRAAFIGAQTLYRPKKYQEEQATASDNISSRLPYIFAVSRFSHYLKCMVRDMIGSNKERDQLQRELQNWVSGYVHGSPANATERDKALLPLAAAKVEVIADEENPGYYVGKFFLRPHFQLEGMDIGMSLVSKLPGAK
jgi:type VI secretion system protein ImpC